MKEEKRNYLKEFRWVSGFLLFFCAFGALFTFGSQLLTYALSYLTDNESLTLFLSELGLYVGTAYTYYVGYRIFLKKWNKKIDIKLRNANILNLILDITVSIILIRFIWIVWQYVMDFLNYNPLSSDGKLGILSYMYLVILAPIFEEIIMRGYILKILKKYGKYVSIIISSIFFGLFHGTFTQAIPCIFIGIIFANLAIKYKSILPSIIAHIITNFISVLNISSDSFLLIAKIIIVTLSIVILIYLLIINFKNVNKIFKEIKVCFLLKLKSASYIIFTILELFNIIFDAINGIFYP